MPVTNLAALDALCEACGIATSYYNIEGEQLAPEFEVKLCLLQALGISVDDDAEIQVGLEKQKSRAWQRMLTPVMVYRQSQLPLRLRLVLRPEHADKPVYWKLCEESGRIHNGHWDIVPGQAIAEHQQDGLLLKQYELELPVSFASGYHQLGIKTVDNCEAQACLILAPDHCYQPPILSDNRVWGISLQLYSLRSRRNWGIGDFSDLLEAIKILAPLGVSLIGLNPLHTLFLHQPEKASPYSPSSRDFLNPIYLDIETIDEFNRCPGAQQLAASAKFQARLKTLRSQPLIDYTEVWAIKLHLLKMLYAFFLHDDIARNSTRARAFRLYQIDGGSDLHKLALFQALQEYFYANDRNCEDWQHWPEDYRNPDSVSVRQWAGKNIEAIEFHQYLQWNAEIQLSQVGEYCLNQGMAIGLYRDLAVANARSSAQCWAQQSQFALDMGIGAPADDFSSNGQDWGLPPLKPNAISHQNYRLFVNTLRANMLHAGALRIDHIMGLMRLFWVPPNHSARQGSYVYYPFADLMGILALESQRNQCLIVGEDLGTVPDEVRHALYYNRILSYRILYFEKNWHEGSFKAPQDYPRAALCCSGSHDLPTLTSFWNAADIDLREHLKLLPSIEFRDRIMHQRHQDRIEMLAALARENLIDATQPEHSNEMDSNLLIAIQRYLARSNAVVMMLQLEDLLMQQQQVNLPGTIDEYPNWRSRLTLELEDWALQSNLKTFAQAIRDERL